MVKLNHLLQEFLDSPESSGTALETLLFEHAEPLVRRIVGRRLSGSISQQDREDTCGDALVEILGRLESWKKRESRPIDDFPAYTSVVARHYCDQYLRNLKSQKYRLRNRIFYLLDNSLHYGEWDGEPGRPVCGWVEHTGYSAKKLEPGWIHSIPVRPGSTEPEIVEQIITACSPLLVDDLLDATAHLAGLSDEASVEAILPAHLPDSEERLDLRSKLGHLWTEIRELPVPQRIALLLHLRDEQGSSPLASLPAMGVASLRQIAEALELPPEELAAMWGKPLSDREIGKRLTLKRQQIIDLRKTARQRLARRGSFASLYEKSSRG